MHSKRKVDEWKFSSVDLSSLSPTDLENFGGIEELTNYEVIKPNKKIKRNVSENKVKTKKKKLKKLKEIDSNLDDQNTNKCTDIDSTSDNKELDLSAWCNCFVPDDILKALKDLQFYKPTQIQELALAPAIRDHQDILAAAETGSGKTLAFGIPILAHIMASKERENERNESSESEHKLKCLILAPTRELAIQVKNHLQAISKYLGIRIICIVGGMSQEKQKRLLSKQPEVIVATPGRLWQLMEENEPHLEQIPFVRYLVIDEADRMVERGHFEELKQILEIINKNKKVKKRQNFIFSATLTMIHDLPKRLEVKRKKAVSKHKLEQLMSIVGIKDKPKIIDITTKTSVVGTLTESQISCTLEEKDIYLYYFVAMHPGRTLVFCNSINSVRRLKSVFELLGCKPLTLHASMHQKQRFKNLEIFASSDIGLLFASDVAARGLDIQGIEHVVHFQVPKTAEVYVHRSGRTARAQKAGLSLILIEPQDAVNYNKICKTLNKEKSLPTFPVDHVAFKAAKERVVLARQIDQQEHRMKRLAAQNRWFIKTAEEMDAEIEDEQLLNELGDDREQSLKNNYIKGMKKTLARLLKKTIVAKQFIGQYPTKMGKVIEPNFSGKCKAIDAVKNELISKFSVKSRKQKRHMYNKNT